MNIVQQELTRAVQEWQPHIAAPDGRCLNDRRPFPCPGVAIATDTVPNLTLLPGTVVDLETPTGYVGHVQSNWVRRHAAKAISRSMELNGYRCVLSIDVDPGNGRARLLRIDILDNAEAAEVALRRAGYAVEWVAHDEYEPVLRVGPTVLAVAS